MDFLKNFLKGKWLGHPLHPALAHVPTALLPAALVFDVLSFSGVGGNAMVRTSFWCIAAALIVILAAATTGLADFTEIKPGKAAKPLGWYHMLLNIAVAIIFLVNVLVRYPRLDATFVRIFEMFLTLIGVIILGVSGYLGARMVFHYGIGIARFSKGEWRKVAERGGANLPEEKKDD